MQLVEQGKLDLDTDVNRYLDFKIPATFPQPITLRHIMTHTPGFEEDARDLISADRRRSSRLAVGSPRTFRDACGRRVRTLVLQLRHGARRLRRAAWSGMPWDDYIEQHVLSLGMTQTTTRQPGRRAYGAICPTATHGPAARSRRRSSRSLNRCRRDRLPPARPTWRSS